MKTTRPRHCDSFIELYMANAHRYSKTTKEYTVLCIERFANFLNNEGGSISLSNVDSKMVEQWVRYMRRINLAYITIYHNLKIMDKVYESLSQAKAKVVKQNPFKTVRLNFPHPTTNTPTINPIDFSKLLKFLKNRRFATKRGVHTAYKGARAYIVIKLLLHTSLTIKEILALKDEMINLGEGSITYRDRKDQLSKELVQDITFFKKQRDKLIPKNSDWFIRGTTGYFIHYHHFKKEFKEWSYLIGSKVNTIKIKEQYFISVAKKSSNDSSFFKASGFKTWHMLEKYRGPRKVKGPRFNVKQESKKTL